MSFMKKTIEQENEENKTLYDVIYNLFFFAKIKESEENTKNGKVCTLKELRQHIDELEEEHENVKLK